MTQVDLESLLADFSGDTTLAEAEAALGKEGLTLGASSAPMTVAEWIARGAPGARDAWLDPADHLIAGFEATLKSGTVIKVRPAPRRAVGPDLLALLFGAKGRYGTITRAWLRVHRLGVPRATTSTPFVSERNPAVSSDEEALLAAIARELGAA